MARIFYSLSGEGRGHATRVRALVEQLRNEHDIRLFTPNDAFDFLEPKYRESAVAVHRIPGAQFRYVRGRFSPLATAAAFVPYLAGLPKVMRELGQLIDRHKPDLIITDFEPILPRVARRKGIPFISLDHQHFMTTSDLSSLPWKLRGHAFGCGLVVDNWYRGQVETIVSCFFPTTLKPRCSNVTQVAAILRAEVRGGVPTNEGYLLCYLRSNTPASVIDVLSRCCQREVRIYGLGTRRAEGTLRFRSIDEHVFLEDLKGCAAVIGAAGHQFLSEALYLGKPVLAIPEEKLHEQVLNAHFIREMGVGDCTVLEQFNESRLQSYLRRLDDFRVRLDESSRKRIDGTANALAAIKRHLPFSSESDKARRAA